MNKELEQHIQQMAEKKYPNNWSKSKDFEDPLLIIGCSRASYEQGVKDADTIGFTEWVVKNYSLDTDGLRWTELKSDIHYTSKQIYLSYLKTKTK